MKATGIVRRIDGLGRIVIPKEISKTLHLRDGDPLEIYTSAEGLVIFKKYSPLCEISGHAPLFAQSLSQQLKCPVAVCDTDVVAASSPDLRRLEGKRISGQLLRILEDRRQYEGALRVTDDSAESDGSVAVPIIANSAVVGAVVILSAKPGAAAAAALAAAIMAGMLE